MGKAQLGGGFWGVFRFDVRIGEGSFTFVCLLFMRCVQFCLLEAFVGVDGQEGLCVSVLL